jgi:hypothetical protein
MARWLIIAAALALWAPAASAQTPASQSEAPAEDGALAFPGAMGWAATTPGGRGGAILRVTTLAADGPGSFREAVETEGPRIIVFEVGGVIDLGADDLHIREPFVTIAGQTAPSPGITFIRGGFIVDAHDVVIQHIRVRVGEAGAAKMAGPDFDGISVNGHDVIVDHCSLTWATDENLSASGDRFNGATPEEWRRGTAYRVTFSNNIIAEGLAYSVHVKGEHSKGSLIHDNADEILIIRNLYSSNMERSPLFKGGARGAVINNLIYNPGRRAVHYNLLPAEWEGQPYQTGVMTLVGNVMRGGPDTAKDLPLFQIGGAGDLDLYESDNLAFDQFGEPLPLLGSYTAYEVEVRRLEAPSMDPPHVEALPARDIEAAIYADVGARPWDRDEHDWRILADVVEGRSEIIDSETEVGGYPSVEPTSAPFDPAAWDLETMTPRS